MKTHHNKSEESLPQQSKDNQNPLTGANDEFTFPDFTEPEDTPEDSDRLTDLGNGKYAYGIWLFQASQGNPATMRLRGLYELGVYKKIRQLGFFKRKVGQEFILIHEVDGIIEVVDLPQLKDVLYKHVEIATGESFSFKAFDQTFSFVGEDLKNTFLGKIGKIIKNEKLPFITDHTKEILRDNRDTSFVFFQNCVVRVTSFGHECLTYQDLDGKVVWRSHIIPRCFSYIEDYETCHFSTFLDNICGYNSTEGLTPQVEDRARAAKSSIGYLLHNYNSMTNDWAVILYDEKSTNDMKNGGTGKGVLVQALRQMRNTEIIDGKMFDPTNKFRYQLVTPETQIMCLDDVKNSFDFSDLFGKVTGNFQFDKLFLGTIKIPPEESPKVLITSNTVMSTIGSSNKRRQQIIEFSDHYSRHLYDPACKTLEEEHGCMFFSDDWDQDEWNRFFSLMIDCLRFYLKNGLMTYEHISVYRNVLAGATSQEFMEYMLDDPEGCPIEAGVEIDPSSLFQQFKQEYMPDSDLKQRTFTMWVKRYAEVYCYELSERKSNGKRLYTLVKK
ncbi:MAG TPA: hypothetical protein P5228_08130 [Bacteroidales bacterium]|nr:hypothetical protein [Bacteroidales bacterium]HRZ49177.1 hypothetical protein [Bacteroidales bacterium]